MPIWTLGIRPPAASTALVVGLFGVSVGLLLVTEEHRARKSCIPSPTKTLLPKLSEAEIAALPYPPDILPGARDVETPYGSIKVFEWGPEDGEKVLLLHGISTPCMALANLAEELVSDGYRVMLFDFFGRGYSDAPTDLPYDMRLHTTQILLVLASSSLRWTGDDGFHLIGYSLGGAIAVPFARYLPHMVRSLVLVAGGGLIRHGHVSWQSKVLYSTGIFPEVVLERLVRRRITPKKAAATNEEKMAGEVVDVKTTKRQKNSDASGGDSYDNAVLSTRRPGLTISAVMGWQLRHQRGFIPAFMSSIRHAPIYDQHEHWEALGRLLAARRKDEGDERTGVELPGLRGGRVLLVLGSTDPVIVREELIHDATSSLGEDGFEAISLDCGHEIVMTKAKEVAGLAADFWKKTGLEE
ncbi:alpha/beta-hydrolase [Lasiosphaeria hispida]|uniref:Alpha/beta-hydrolase n=1 Tax=Lasiosphaeria hispida TaxID=260671 RepID=A0AAJ0MK10_9PEZI|nr:alpha/beta-hydrolase [Lasiosphaeria hispida]